MATGVFGSVVSVLMALVPSQPAVAAINPTINFQGKLVNANGTNVPDGMYNLEFKLYTGGNGCVGGGSSPCGGTLQWTEDRVFGSGSPDNRVTVTDGVFDVNLGSITSLPAVFNNNTIWLSINLGNTSTAATFGAASGDGEMLPMVRLTSAAYAFNSDLLDGLDSTQFARTDASNTLTGNSQLFKNTADSTTSFQIQPAASGTSVLDVDTQNSRVGVGLNAPAYKLDVAGDINTSTGFRVGGVAGVSQSCSGGNFAVSSTLSGGIQTGTAACFGTGSFINNQTTLQASANFDIQSVGTGSVTGVFEDLGGQTADLVQFQDASTNPMTTVDTNGYLHFKRAAAAGDNVVTSRVTGDTNDRFTLGADGKLSFGAGGGAADVTLARGGVGNLTETSSATTANADTITANSLSTGSALSVTSSNDSGANTGWSAVSFNPTNAQSTTAVSTGQIAGLDVQFTQNPTVAGNTETVANLAVKRIDTSVTDNTVSSILNLANNDTSTGNQITATDGLKINGANVTNGIDLSGTFGTNLITASNFSVSQSGAIVGVGVNSGVGVIQGTGGLSVTGTVNENVNTNSGTNINTGTSAGTVAIGGGSADLVIDSTHFDVSSAGALSGITTISTSGAINGQTISASANFTGTLTTASTLTVSAGGAAITGTATDTVAFQAPAFDTAAAGVLTIGGTNATSETIGQTTTNFTLQGASGAAGSAITGTNGANTTTVKFTNPTTARSILFPDEGGTICIQFSSNCGFAIGTFLAKNAQDTSSVSVAGTLYQFTNTNTGASSVLSLTGSGTNAALTVTNTGNSTSGVLVVNNSNGTPSGDLLELQTGGVNKLTVDTTGKVNGQTISSAANFTGTLTTNGTLTVAGTTTDITTGTNEDLTLVANGTGQIVLNDLSQVPTLGSADTANLLCRNSSNQIATCTSTITGTPYVQGGNSFGAAGDLGTNDNFQLNIRTNNATRLTISTAGDLTYASGAGGFDQSASTGTFKTGTGNVTLNGNTSVATGKSLTVTNGQITQSFNGDTAANTSWDAAQINVTNQQSTTAVSTGLISGLDLQFTQNATIAGNNETVANFAIAQNNSSSTDAAVSSILNLANNDTATGNQIVATDGLKINGANVTNGIDLSGTFGTNLITSSNFTVAQGGGVTTAGNLTVQGAGTNTFSGQIQFSGVATDIATAGNEDLTVTPGGTGQVILSSKTQVGTLGTADTSASLCRNSLNQIASCLGGGGTPFVEGGNSFGHTADLGTNDNFGLNIRTNNTTKLTVSTGGDLTFAGGGVNGSFDQSASTGTFKTGSGAVSLNGDTTVAAGKNLSLASGAGSFSQAYTGTTGTATSIVATSLTSGSALAVTSLNNTGANTAWSAAKINVTNAQATTAVTGANLISGLDLQFTQSTAVAGNNETAANFAIAANGAASTDATVNSIVNLANNDTATGNQIVATNGLLIQGANVTNGINLSGTFGTNLITSSNFTVAQGGGVTTAGSLTVQGTGANTFSGQVQFSGVATDIATAGNEDLTITPGGTGQIILSNKTQVGTLGTTDTSALLCRNSLNQIAACSATLTGSAFVQGGNTFGAAGDLGTNDNFGLNIRTNNATKLTVSTGGDLTFAGGGVNGSFDQSASTGTFKTGSGAVSLNGDTTVAAGKNLSLASGAGTFTQTYTGTGTAHSITASSLTTGSVLSTTSSNNSAANTAWSAVALNVTSLQGTTAVSTGSIAGLDVEFTQNAAVAGNTETVANLAVAQNNSASTDATVSSILNLANNDTATGNQITVADGLKINGANVTNGINLSGTFGTSLITSSNFSVSQAGAIVGVGVNSGTGLVQGTGGVTLTGTAQINATGAGATTIGSSAGGAVSIQGGAGGTIVNDTSGNLTLSTTTSGTLAVTSAGALNLTGAAASTVNVGANTLAVTSSNFNVSTAGVLNVVGGTAGFQIGGAATTGHFLRGNGTSYVDGTIQATDATGVFVKNVPTATSDNVINPGANAAVALTVRGSSDGSNPNILEIRDSGNGLQDFFDSTGKLNVAQIIQPTTNNAVDLGVTGTNTFRTGYFGTSVVAAGTTLNGNSLTFGSAGTATIQPAASQALTITAHGTSTWSTDTGNLTVGTTAASGNLTLDSGTGGIVALGNTNATTINIGAGATATTTIAGGNVAHTVAIAAGGTSTVQSVSIGSPSSTSTFVLQAGTGTAGGDINIGDQTTAAKRIDIGSVDNAGTTTVNIATAAAAQTVTIGSTTGSGTTNLQAGTGNTNVLANNSNTAAPIFSLQQAGAGDASQEYRDTSTSFYSGVDASAGHLFVINSKAAATDAAITTLGQDYSSQVPNGTDNNATQIQATKFTASATGTLSQMSIAIDSDQAGDTYSLGIFGDNGSGTAPAALLGQYTGTKTPVISNPGSINWNTITLDAPVSITSGTVYWLALETNTATLFFKQRTGVGASSIYRSGVTTGTWANPWTSNGSANTTSGNEIGIYGTIVGSTTLTDTFASPLFTLSQSGQLTLKNITNSSSQLTVQNAAGTTLLQEDSLNGQLGVYTAALFKNNANSTTALQVQTSTGTNLLVVDTTTPGVKIGATGTSTSASTIDIADTSNATGTQTITIGSNAKAANTVNIDAGNTTGKIQIGNSTTAHTIQIGNGGTSAQAVTIGSTSSTSTTTITGGVNGTTPTVSLQAAASGVIALGTTNANTIQIGAVGSTANADTIHIADSTGAAQAITIGGLGTSGNSNAGTTVKLQGGATSESIANAGDTIQTFTNSATAFQIQNATSSSILKVGTTTVRTNFITNPGGEAAVTASDWPTGGNGTAVTVSQDTSNAMSGVGSIKAVTTGTANRGAKNVLSATLASSTAYSLTFYAKASGSNFATLSVDYLYDGTNSDGTVSCSALAVVTGGWTRYSCFFTTSASGTHTKTAANAIVLMQTDAASRTWYMDNVLLEQISTTADAYGAGQAQLDAVITGPIAVQNTENSTTALTVMSAAGSALLTADTLNMGVNVGGALTATGNTTVGTANNGNLFKNNGATQNVVCAYTGLSGTINPGLATATKTVNDCTSFTLTDTGATTISALNAPTAGAGSIIYVSNLAASTNPVVLLGVNLNAGATATLLYDGVGWRFAGTDSSSLQAAYNNSSGGTTPSIAVSTVKSAVTIQNSVTNPIGAGTELFGVRSAAANDTTLGNSLLTVTSYGIGVNLGSDSAVSGNDLQFGGNADRVIRVISATTANQIGGALTVAAGAANGTSTGAAGGQLNLNGGNAAGTNSNNGGAVAIQGGTASNNATSVGGVVTIQGGTAGATAGSTGGAVTINGGAGTGTGTGAGGSAVNINGGNAGGSNSNVGGTIAIQGGTGSTNGNGGAVTVQGGTAAGTGTGGTLNINGGLASATAGSIGGAVAVAGAAGATSASGTAAGAGGGVTVSSGSGGANSSSGNGGNAADVQITAGNGGNAGTGSNGNGGNVRLTAGSAGSGAGANGTPGVVFIDSPVFTSVTETFTQSGNNQTFTTGTDPTLQTNVDGFGTIVVTVSGAFTGASITMPAPRNTSAGHLLYIVATQASASFTLTSTNMPSFSVAAGDTATLVWNGSNWTAGVAASSLQQVYNSTSTSPASIVTTSTAKTLLVQAGAGFDSSSLLTVSNANGAALWNIDTTNPITDLTNNANNNEVTNGSFESTTAVTGWVKMGTVNQIAVAQDTSQASIGSASMKVVTISTDTAGTDGAKYNLTTSTLVSNTQYTLSFNARTQAGFSGSSWATMEIGHADNGSTNTSCLTAQTVVATGWTRYTCSFTTGATSGTPYVYIRETDASTHTFWVDGVSLQRWSILANASVEQAIAGNWTAKGTPTTFQQSATQHFDGADSLQVVTQATASQGAKESITLNDSTMYTLQFEMINTGAAFTDMEAGYSSDGSTDNTPCVTGQTVGASFTAFTCTFTTPSSHSGTPYFYIKQAAGTIHTFFIDAVQLNISNPLPSAYQEGKLQLGGTIISPMVLQNQTDSTTAVLVQNAAATSTLLTVDTLNSVVRFGDSTNNLTIASTREPTLNGTARHSKTVRLNAEYVGAVLDADGTNNLGTMTAAYDATQRMGYYKWTTSQASAQDYDIVVTLPVPDDWSAWTGFPTFKIYTSGGTGYGVTATITKSDGTTDASYNAVTLLDGSHNNTTATWLTVSNPNGGAYTNNTTISALTGSGYSAGGIMNIRIHLTAAPPVSGTAQDVRVGDIYLPYSSKF